MFGDAQYLFFVLDPKLQQGQKLPRWEPRSRRGMFVGLSPVHASDVPLVLNLTSGAITAQFHVVFDNLFTMNNHQITGNNYVLTTLPLP